jgi:S1-C subfamily serine protease
MIQMSCPSCGEQFTFADGLRGKTLRCTKCKAGFEVKGVQVENRVPSDSMRSRVPAAQIQEQPRPARPAKPSRDEDEPHARPRRPRRREQASSGGVPVSLVIVGGAVALLLLIVGGGVGAWIFLSKRSSTAAASATAASPSTPNSVPTGAGSANSGGNGPAPFGGGNVAPAGNEMALRYQWKGGPHIYHVKVEVDHSEYVEVHESNFVIQVGSAGARPAAPAVDHKAGGTGFVINANGWLLTCNHVVADAKKIDVILGGKTYAGQVTARNAAADLAVVRVNAQDLPTLSFGDSDAAEVGQDVWALGYPLSDVLGNNLKATRGTLSGVNTRGGAKVLQIDASVNPGNSGGPMVGDTGLVLGVTKAKLAGEAISNVGFATPSNETKRWLTAQNVPFTTGGWTTKLDGPPLVKRVSPATAQIIVTLDAGAATGGTTVLSCRGALPKVKVPKTGSNMRPELPGMPKFASSRVVVDALGEIQDATNGIQMPCLLGDVVSFLVDALPGDERQAWDSANKFTIEEVTGGGSEFGPFGPRGMPRMPGMPSPGGMPGMPSMPRPPFGPPGMGGLPGMRPPGIGPGGPGGGSSEKSTFRTGEERSKYTRGGAAGDTVQINKTYEMTVPAAAGQADSLTLTGNGVITFDVKNGLPKRIEFSGTFDISVKNVHVRLPFTVNYRLLEGEERERILKPAPAPSPNSGTNPPAASQGSRPPATAQGSSPSSKAPEADPFEELPDAKDLFASKPRVFLNDMQEFGVKNGPWQFSKYGLTGNPNSERIHVGGKEYPKALGMHPPNAPEYAAAKFRLGKQAALFRARVALDDACGFVFDGAYFEVWGDGKKLWETQIIQKPKTVVNCEVKVTDVDVLELRVRAHQNHIGLHSVWLDPRILKAADTPDK